MTLTSSILGFSFFSSSEVDGGGVRESSFRGESGGPEVETEGDSLREVEAEGEVDFEPDASFISTSPFLRAPFEGASMI